MLRSHKLKFLYEANFYFLKKPFFIDKTFYWFEKVMFVLYCTLQCNLNFWVKFEGLNSLTVRVAYSGGPKSSVTKTLDLE